MWEIEIYIIVETRPILSRFFGYNTSSITFSYLICVCVDVNELFGKSVNSDTVE